MAEIKMKLHHEEEHHDYYICDFNHGGNPTEQNPDPQYYEILEPEVGRIMYRHTQHPICTICYQRADYCNCGSDSTRKN